MAKSKFCETLHVILDPNIRKSDPVEYLAHTSVESAIDEDGPTDVAEYKLVRVRKFRKETVECK